MGNLVGNFVANGRVIRKGELSWCCLFCEHELELNFSLSTIYSETGVLNFCSIDGSSSVSVFCEDRRHDGLLYSV